MQLKTTRIISSFIFICFSASIIAAENANENSMDPRTIVNTIVMESNGNVSIEMSDDLYQLLIPQKKERKTINRHGTYRTTGYRVQIFSDGRNQHTLEARANARGNAVLARFPKYRGQVYTFSKSPNWFTRVGNFETLEEANAALQELKRAFPSFAGEMRTVKCEVLMRK